MFKHLKLVLNEEKPQEKQQLLTVILQPETQVSLGTGRAFSQGNRNVPFVSGNVVTSCEDLSSAGEQIEAWKKMKSSISSLSVHVGVGEGVWLSSVTAEALKAKQMAGDRFRSLLHRLRM